MNEEPLEPIFTAEQQIRYLLPEGRNKDKELNLTTKESKFPPTHPKQSNIKPRTTTPKKSNGLSREFVKQPTREGIHSNTPHIQSTSLMSLTVRTHNQTMEKEAKTHPPDPGGHTQATLSFSRTCPITLQYSRSGQSIEGLAIIDDQASHSLVYPTVIEDLGIEKQDQCLVTHSTTTILGLAVPSNAFIIEGLIIKPNYGNTPIQLERAITHPLPNMLQSIPSREQVNSIPGLKDLALQFPKKQNWPTVLLLGRDCLEVLIQTNQTWSDDGCLLATRTPLGYVVMGNCTQNRE